jgi:hypothetical protein
LPKREILKEDEDAAYFVELFGAWVKYNDRNHFVAANQTENGAFMQTIGVEIVLAHQLILTISAQEKVKIGV